MSQFTLSPAVLQRIQSFAEEVEVVGQIAAYLADFFDSGMHRASLDEMRGTFNRAYQLLAETRGGEDDDENEVYPLPQSEPYLLPMALDRIAVAALRSAPIVLALAASASDHEYLALDYFAASVREIGVTAGHLCATVREELPPLAAHATVETMAMTA